MPQIPNVTSADSPGIAPRSYTAPIDRANPIGAAGERLGQTIEGIGELQFHIQNVYQESLKNKATTSLSAAGADALDSLNDPNNPKNSDPGSFETRVNGLMQKAADAQEKGPGMGSLSPLMRQQYETEKAQIMAQVGVKTKHAAMSKQVDLATATYEVQQANQIKSGDEEGALATSAYMVEHGLKRPEQGAQDQIEIPQKVDYSKAINLMQMDPVTTAGGPQVLLDQLSDRDANGNPSNFKRLPAQQRAELEFYANRTLNIVRNQIGTELFQDSMNMDRTDPEQVQGMKDKVHLYIAKGLITRGEAQKYLVQPKEYDEDRTAALSIGVAHYNPDTDPDGREWAKLTIAGADKAIPEAARAQAMADLKEKREGRGPKSSQVQKSFYEDDKKDGDAPFLPGHYVTRSVTTDTHWFKPNETKEVSEGKPFKDVKHWQDTATPEEKNAAALHHAKYLDDMDSYFKAHAHDNQGAGPLRIDVEKYSESLKQPYYLKAATDIVSGKGTSGFSKAEIEAEIERRKKK